MKSKEPSSSTFVTLLTPAGRGAVATVCVAGHQAAELIAAQFTTRAAHISLADAPVGQVFVGQFGTWREEVVACRIEGNIWEIHCHGGQAAAAATMASLAQAGCQPISWADWLRTGHQDLLRAEAQIALAQAPTERTAGILLDQYQGALGRVLGDLEGLVAQGEAAEADRRAREVLARTPLGTHLTEPWRVVLAGRPNVGKSSLINALLGYGRLLTDAEAGTTRDVVTAVTAMDGWPVLLTDTAGLRPDAPPLEAAGIYQAEAALQAADLVVWVLDATSVSGSDEELCTALAPQSLRVVNKIDLLPSASTTSHASGDAIGTSAHTGAGIECLLAAIAARLVPAPPPPGAAVPFLPRHVDELRRFVQP